MHQTSGISIKKEEERTDKAFIQNVPTDFILNYRQATYILLENCMKEV